MKELMTENRVQSKKVNRSDSNLRCQSSADQAFATRGILRSATWNAPTITHRQFDSIFKNRKIKEQEVTLELILPNFSGK